MMSVKHQNIVGFIGYCSHTEQEALQMTRKHVFADDRERLLCFEYISKGSLEDHVTGMKRLLLYCCKTSTTPRKKNTSSLGKQILITFVLLINFKDLSQRFKKLGCNLISSIASLDELRGLEWHIRFQIIKGICQGLHHLHKEKSIIHMDLKPANILLNDDLVPKITDFGISRSGEISETMSEVRMYSP